MAGRAGVGKEAQSACAGGCAQGRRASASAGSGGPSGCWTGRVGGEEHARREEELHSDEIAASDGQPIHSRIAVHVAAGGGDGACFRLLLGQV